MKVLVIGDSNSIFVKQYIEYVLIDGRKNQIVLIEENTTNEDYLTFYKDNNIAIEKRINRYNWVFGNIPKVRSSLANYLWARYIKNKYGRFDIVHIHGLNYSRGNIGMYMRDYSNRMVITVWGDEIFRATPKTLKSYEKYYSAADRITLSTSNMYRFFSKIYKSKFQSTITMNKFGIGLLEYIDEVKSKYSREQLCLEFGIEDPKKLTVFIGHNGRGAQRHIEITKALAQLSKEIREKVILVYTMTYGIPSDSYLIELEKEAQKTKCEYTILRKYLNEEKTAKLRNVCDIMIHAQQTDAFSASICESLYAGTVILNGSWLIYDDLPNFHERFVEYDEIAEIPHKLEDVVRNISHYRKKLTDNKKVIRSICSKDVTTKKWRESVFDQLN